MTVFDKIFKDKHGNTVLFQTPNSALITYMISLLLGKVTDGTLQQVFETLGFGALFVFAWLELFQGVNYFRRALGLVVLIVIVMSRVSE